MGSLETLGRAVVRFGGHDERALNTVFFRLFWAAFIATYGAVFLNLAFLFLGFGDGQITLAFIYPVVVLFYVLLPRSSFVLSAVGTATRAAGQGEQAVAFSHLRSVGTALAWVEVYLLGTLFISANTIPRLVLVLHILLLILLFLLLSGKISVSQKSYDALWRLTIVGVLLIGVIAMVPTHILQAWNINIAALGPSEALKRAERIDRLEAENRDRAAAKCLEPFEARVARGGTLTREEQEAKAACLRLLPSVVTLPEGSPEELGQQFAGYLEKGGWAAIVGLIVLLFLARRVLRWAFAGGDGTSVTSSAPARKPSALFAWVKATFVAVIIVVVLWGGFLLIASVYTSFCNSRTYSQLCDGWPPYNR